MTTFDENTARAIVAAIVKDGAADAYMSASEDERTEMILAYMADLVKRTEKMQTMYLTNKNFRDNFRSAVYELCV